MKVHDKKTLKELQKEFNQVFPYLKIEFFKKPHPKGTGSEEEYILDANLTVGEVRNMDTAGFIHVDGKMPVGVFEKNLAETFGLYAQVYRKSHGKWLQTWVTDVWTLEEQNNRGRVMGDIDNLLAS